MTVAELIAKLRDMPQDARVFVAQEAGIAPADQVRQEVGYRDELLIVIE